MSRSTRIANASEEEVFVRVEGRPATFAKHPHGFTRLTTATYLYFYTEKRLEIVYVTIYAKRDNSDKQPYVIADAFPLEPGRPLIVDQIDDSLQLYNGKDEEIWTDIAGTDHTPE